MSRSVVTSSATPREIWWLYGGGTKKGKVGPPPSLMPPMTTSLSSPSLSNACRFRRCPERICNSGTGGE